MFKWVFIVKKFAVVILNYNTFEDSVTCIDSIRKYTARDSYKIFIVDNASPDKSGDELKIKYENNEDVSVLISEKNLGFSGGNNIGIQAALNDGFEYIYLLNSDIILLNDAFSYMQDAFETSDDVAIVGPSIFSPEKKYVQYARKGISLATYLTSQRSFEILFPGLNEKLRYYKFSAEKDFSFDGMVSGCCFGMSANFIRTAQCLDDRIFMYYEEDILAYSLKNFSKKAMIAAKAKIVHNEGASTKKSSSDRLLFTRFYRWSSVLYVLKNYAKLTPFICKLISLQNIVVWCLLSLKSEKYREKFGTFIKENKKALK